VSFVWRYLVGSINHFSIFKQRAGGNYFALTLVVCVVLVLILTLTVNTSLFSGIEFPQTFLSKIRNHFYVDASLVTILVFYREYRKYNLDGYFVVPLAAYSFLVGTGLSGGISEYGVFMTVGVSIIYLLSMFGEDLLVKLLASASFVVIIMGLFTAKVDSPFNWWSYSTPSALNANLKADSGLSKGLYFSKEQLKSYNEINAFVAKAKANCGPNVYVYPAMPMFQLNAGIQPPGILGNYWFDFSSGPGIEEQIEFIKETGIDAVVYFNVPTEVTTGHSTLFQNGKSLPQEKLGFELMNFLSRLDDSDVFINKKTSMDYNYSFGPVRCLAP
jgi:hypothetical protein